ncbi:MAG: hypothetical protein ACXACP_06620 [Candidatus Hodarchaeales archaeon]|jgi:hypothetical protein
MTKWVNVTEEEETILFRWLINQIIDYVKSTEKAGTRSIQYLTKIKLQKMLFLVAEDAKINLTRSWYMFGGMVFPSFDLHNTARSFYYGDKKESIPTKTEISKLIHKSQWSSIFESIKTNFTEIFFTKTKDYLEKFYSERAPKQYRKVYEEYRTIKGTFEGLLDYQRQLDYELRAILPTFDPWTEASRLQKQITNFQLTLPGIISESVLFLVVEYTRLMQKTAIQVLGMKNEGRALTRTQRQIINQIEEDFTERMWKLIANHIAIDTFTGVRAEECQLNFISSQKTLIDSLRLTLTRLERKLEQTGLKPSANVLKIFFEKEYGEMITELMGETNDHGEDPIENPSNANT